jgi:hypothetical protein
VYRFLPQRSRAEVLELRLDECVGSPDAVRFPVFRLVGGQAPPLGAAGGSGGTASGAGLASGFTYQFVLTRDQKRWFDNKLDTSTLEVTAMYNAVTREYLVNFKQDGKLVDSRIALDREELERAMTRFSGLTLFHLGDINPNKRISVRARAELGSKTTLLIIPTRVKTDWVRSRKFRLPADLP